MTTVKRTKKTTPKKSAPKIRPIRVPEACPNPFTAFIAKPWRAFEEFSFITFFKNSREAMKTGLAWSILVSFALAIFSGIGYISHAVVKSLCRNFIESRPEGVGDMASVVIALFVVITTFASIFLLEKIMSWAVDTVDKE